MRKKLLDWFRGRSEFSIHWSYQTWCERHRNWHWVHCTACFDEFLFDRENGASLEMALELRAEREAHRMLGEGYFA